MNEHIKRDFDKETENTIKVGRFLSAYDPVLKPYEGLSKYGISLASGFVGLSTTLLALFNQSNAKESINNLFLFFSWILFLGAIGFGVAEICRTMRFRMQMRKFAYVLLGDFPAEKDKKEALSIGLESAVSAIILESLCLFVGIIFFVLWCMSRISIFL